MPGGPDKAQDRLAFLLGFERAHGDVFQDALFGFFQPVVVAFEHPGGVFDIQVILGHFLPGQVEDPIDVGADDAHFGRHGRHLVQAFDFLHGRAAGQFGQLGCIDFLLQVDQVAREDVAFAQFGLDLLHLFAQIELALALIHLVLHPAVDLVFQFQHIQFLGQQFVDALQALARVLHQQQLLAFGQVDRDRRGDHIRQPARLGDVHGKEMRLFGDGPVQRDTALEQVQGVAHQCLGGLVGSGRLRDDACPHLEHRRQAGKLDHFHPQPSLHQRRRRTIRHREQPSDRQFHPDGQEILRPGVFHFRVPLGQADDGLVAFVGFLDGQQRTLAHHKDRRDHVRENDDVAQRQDQRLDTAVLIRRLVWDPVQFLRPLCQRHVESFIFLKRPIVLTHVSSVQSQRCQRYLLTVNF